MAENNTVINVSYQFMYSLIPLTLICLFGEVSNILLLVAFTKDPLKCFRNSGTYLVMNLSVSDCLICLVAPLYYATKNEMLKTVSNSIIEFLAFWFGAASFLSITSISIDRFFIVVYPIKHRILMKGKVMILWLSAIWIVSCVVAALSLIHVHTNLINGRNITQIVSVIVIILSSVMYSSTYYQLKKQSRNIALQNPSDSRAQEIRILKERRFLKTIILVACIAFSCVVPYMIFYLSYGLLNLPKDNLTSEIIGTASLVILFINFAVNPSIYILRLPNYRKTFYLLYYKK